MRDDWGAAVRIEDPDGYRLYLFEPPEMTVEEDYSEPILEGDAPSDYERYLRTEELLSLQKTPEEWAHRDAAASSRPFISPPSSG